MGQGLLLALGGCPEGLCPHQDLPSPCPGCHILRVRFWEKLRSCFSTAALPKEDSKPLKNSLWE